MAKPGKPQQGSAVKVVEALVRPVVEGMDLRLWDVRFEKEGASWYLRLFIDKEGGVTIDDCENLSRRMDKILDEADPISQSYYFEVSSPGIGRDLVRPWHFERYLGEQIEVKLIRPMQLENGSSLREFVAPLCSCDDQTITVELDGPLRRRTPLTSVYMSRSVLSSIVRITSSANRRKEREHHQQ